MKLITRNLLLLIGISWAVTVTAIEEKFVELKCCKPGAGCPSQLVLEGRNDKMLRFSVAAIRHQAAAEGFFKILAALPPKNESDIEQLADEYIKLVDESDVREEDRYYGMPYAYTTSRDCLGGGKYNNANVPSLCLKGAKVILQQQSLLCNDPEKGPSMLVRLEYLDLDDALAEDRESNRHFAKIKAELAELEERGIEAGTEDEARAEFLTREKLRFGIWVGHTKYCVDKLKKGILSR